MSAPTADELYDMSDSEYDAAFSAMQREGSNNSEVEDTEAESGEDLGTEVNDDLGTEEADESPGSSGSVEQPEEDSTHSSSTTEDEVDAEESESDTEDGDLDGDTNEEEGSSEDEADTKDEEVQPASNIKVRASGVDYEFTEEEIMEKFPEVFGKAVDYTKKMQVIKPWRKIIDAMETEKLTPKDMNLMIDVLKGNKDAMSEVLRRTGVDALDLDAEDSKYEAKEYGRDDKALDVKDIIEGIKHDPEYGITESVLSSKWDDKSWETMSADPDTIRLLHNDVKSGLYGKLQPIADKLKVFGGNDKSDLEYYGMAAREYSEGLLKTEQAARVVAEKAKDKLEADKVASDTKAKELKAQEATRESKKKASAKRKAAVTTKTAATGKSTYDLPDDSEEGFDEWFAGLGL
jgi:hypothetical protein